MSILTFCHEHRLERLGAKVVALMDEQGDGNHTGRLAYLRAVTENEPGTF